MKIDPAAAGFDARRLARIDEHLLARYIEPGKIAGAQVVVARGGDIAHFSSLGQMDRERQRPVLDDTIWRLYSMTKPITGAALMTLYEQGRFQLSDPIHRYLPEFKDMQVIERHDDGTRHLVPAEQPISVRDAMMHMTGIGFGPPEARMDMASLTSGGIVRGLGANATLDTLMGALAQEPLRFHPGRHWFYSWSTDVCARLVEVISGRRFSEYLRDTIFEPLGMVDTGFHVPEEDGPRLAALYLRGADRQLTLLDDPEKSRSLRVPAFESGGGGLLGTTADYLRFCQMLQNGGELDGVRVLGPKTVAMMASNHLPGDGSLAEVAYPGGYGEVGFGGMGFGLTVAVSQGPVATAAAGSRGEYMWGGAASTLFWIDPVEKVTVIFMTQLIPSGTFNFRNQLKALVYGALVDSHSV